MINVDFEKTVEHIIKFDEIQIKDILIEALRITGHDVPDLAEIECEEASTFEVFLTFTQEELEEYLEEKAELAEPPEEEGHWSTDAEEVNGDSQPTCSGCPAGEK